jgi:uncharacterized protein YceK
MTLFIGIQLNGCDSIILEFDSKKMQTHKKKHLRTKLRKKKQGFE